MNPTKLLEDTRSILSRYAPILVVHVILLAWLSGWVIEPGIIAGNRPLQAWIADPVDSALNAIGLNLSRRYAVVGALFIYIIAFEWVCFTLTSLAAFRIRYPNPFDQALLGQASDVLRVQPERWRVHEALSEQVEKYEKEIREAGRVHPYQWLYDREHTLYRYYGAVSVALVGAVGWVFEGGTLARSVGDVRKTVFLLALAWLGLRWRIRLNYLELSRSLGYWVLREHARRQKEIRPDPLGGLRRKLLEEDVTFSKAIEKTPAAIVRSLLWRLPRKFTEKIIRRLNVPWRSPNEEWLIVASRETKFGDEEHTPPSALRVDGFVQRFSGLLECSGAGLCMLVPQRLGLAPSVDGRGAQYSFAERRHGGYLLGISLRSDVSLSDSRLMALRGFITEIGDYPIERIAQLDFPSDKRNWYELIYPSPTEGEWGVGGAYEHEFANIKLSKIVPLNLSSSYIVVSRDRDRTHCAAAFQCFQVEGSEKLLVAWRILAVDTPKRDLPAIAPWWQPRAWMDVWRMLRSGEK